MTYKIRNSQVRQTARWGIYHGDRHTATASGTTAIDLSWSAPGSTGGSAITGYRIEVSSNGGSSWTNLVANTSNTTTTYAHTGLTAGTTRHYRVSAINTNGTGTASNVANATTGQTTVTFGASSYTAAEGAPRRRWRCS